MIYLSKDQILLLHDKLIKRYGASVRSSVTFDLICRSLIHYAENIHVKFT